MSAPLRRLLTAVLVATLTASGALFGAPAAFAHAVRIACDPAENAVVAAGPRRVSATFNEAMQPEFAAMTVVGPDGNLWSDGNTVVSGAVVSVAVRPLGPAGAYTVNYRATSADGHVVNGSWSFMLSKPGPGAPGPAATAGTEAPVAPSDAGGLPVWPFLVGAAVLLLGAGVWAVRRRR
jgi:copper resistance protein C